MKSEISKIALLTDELIGYIPNECKSKRDLELWLNKNPYSPYVSLYAGKSSLKFDKSKSFVSSLDNKDRIRIDDNIYFKLENFETFDNKILSANGKLENLIEAKELFEHYPDFKKIDLQINISYINNGFHDGKILHNENFIKKIEVNADNSINAMKVLIHKLQNAIQLKEKFKVSKSYFQYDEIEEKKYDQINKFQTLEEANELLKGNSLFQEEITAQANLFLNADYFFENKNKYKTKLILINPDEYIQAVKLKQPRHAIDMKKIKKLEGFAKEGLKFEIPYLRYGSIDIDEEEDKYTFGQEGYNRSLIAKDKKIKEIPVIICYREEDESIPNFIKEKLNPSIPINQKSIYDKIFSEDGKFNLDKKLREYIPRLEKSFKDINSFKKNIPSYIESPVGKIHVNLLHAFNHMSGENSTKMNRTKYNGNFLKELTNPLLVIKTDYNEKEGYYFYNISKDSNNNLVNTLHCLIKKNDILEHKTFYKFANGLGKIKRFLNESEVIHCHKLLTDISEIKSERIHYSNVNSIIQEKENKVNIINEKPLEHPKNIVYHGSNSDFNKFSLDYVKNGIGVNLFGFGVYCSESQNIAKNYGKELGTKIKINDIEYNSSNPEHYAINILKSNCNVIKNALFELKREMLYAQTENYEFHKQAYEILKEEKENIYKHKKTIEDNSILYKMQIPNQRYFIKEGYRIASQNKEIINIIENIDKETFPNVEILEDFLNNKISGMEFYNGIAKSFNDNEKLASEYLYKLGIKGISIKTFSSLLDYSSDEKYCNYVVFNDSDIKILRKETPTGIIEFKNEDKIYNNEDTVNRLLSIVPSGINISFVKDFLLFNGISQSFVNDIKDEIFFNKILINDSKENEDIKNNEYFTPIDNLEVKEIENIYIKTIIEEKDEKFNVINNQIPEIEDFINLKNFQDITNDIEISKIDNMREEQLNNDNLEKENLKENSYEVIARLKVTI